MVSVILVVCSLSVFLSMCLFVLCVLCLTVLVNCLFNAFAMCVGKVHVSSLKVSVVFGVCCFCWFFVICIISNGDLFTILLKYVSLFGL